MASPPVSTLRCPPGVEPVPLPELSRSTPLRGLRRRVYLTGALAAGFSCAGRLLGLKYRGPFSSVNLGSISMFVAWGFGFWTAALLSSSALGAASNLPGSTPWLFSFWSILLRIPLRWTSWGAWSCCALAILACVAATSLNASAASGGGGSAAPSFPLFFRLPSIELRSAAVSVADGGSLAQVIGLR